MKRRALTIAAAAVLAAGVAACGDSESTTTVTAESPTTTSATTVAPTSSDDHHADVDQHEHHELDHFDDDLQHQRQGRQRLTAGSVRGPVRGRPQLLRLS